MFWVCNFLEHFLCYHVTPGVYYRRYWHTG